MSGEGKNINKLFWHWKRLFSSLLFWLIILTFYGCSSFAPELLTYGAERERIVEDVLKRGRVYSIHPGDEEALIALLKDPEPEVRLTVLKIMEKNPSQVLYDAILEATLDEEDSVSEDAFRILSEQWEDAHKAAVRGLDGGSVSLILSSVNVISRMNSRDDAPYLLTLFSDSRDVVRSAASRTYARLGDYENPWFQVLLTSQDPVVRLTAVQTLPRFHDSALVPDLIPYVKDPDKNIRSAALFGLSEYDAEALPYLHEALLESEDDELRISLLQIVEGVLEEQSIPVLLQLLEDDNEKIALKSVEILTRLGRSLVVPFLLNDMEKFSSPALMRVFTIVEKFQDLRLLPPLSRFFNDPDPQVAEKAVQVISSYGESASDYLISQLTAENPFRIASLELLVKLREPLLVYNEEYGGYRTDNIFLLFETLPEDDLLAYLSDIPLPSRIVSSLWSLYDIESNVQVYKKSRNSARYELYPYFYFFLEWEQYLLNAKASRAGAFQYQQNFFNSGDETWLRESRILRNTADWYEKGAENAFQKAVKAEQTADEEEKQICRDYLESRRSLVTRWRTLSSDIQKMARLVFLRYSVNIDSLAENFDFFRSLPADSIPSPEKV